MNTFSSQLIAAANAFSGCNSTPQDFKCFVGVFINIGNSLLPVIAGLALLYFFWGLSTFILHAGDQKARDEAKQTMLWGIISFVVMFSIWGIVQFFYLDFFDTSFGIPLLPH